MKQFQIKINVCISKVKLQVRFPCSLYAQLKIDSQQVSFGSDVPLRFGQACIQQSVSAKCRLLYDMSRKEFIEKKASICLFLTTSSGRIPAGTAYINLNSLKKGATADEISIQKCPDKNAYLQVKIGYEILKEIEENTNSNHSKQIIVSHQLISLRQYPSKELNKSKGKRSYHEQIIENQSINQSLNTSKRKGNINNQIQAFYNSRNNSNFNLGPNSERQYQYNNTSSPAADYTSRGKYYQLQRQLKNISKKYQQLMVELKATTAKKDSFEKASKEVEVQLKAYKEKYQDLQEANIHQARRDQYKQTSYKQQIKALTEKLGNSEKEKQLMIFEKNQMINQFENREKTLRLGLKQKQKALNDQKAKLIKKTQEISKQLGEVQRKSNEHQYKVTQLIRDKHGDTKKYELMQSRYEELVKQSDKLRQLYSAEKLKRESLQQSIKDQASIQEDKRKLKKKISEAQQEISKILNNAAVTDSNLQKALKKIEETDNLLKEKSTSLKNIQKDNDTLKKQRDNYSKKLQQSEKKIAQISQELQNQLSQIQNLQEQIKQTQKRYFEEAKLLKKEIRQKQTRINALTEEEEENSQQIRDYNKKIQQQSKKIDQLNNKINLLCVDNEQMQRLNQKLLQSNNELQIALALERKNKQQMHQSLQQQMINKQIEHNQSMLRIAQLEKESVNKQEQYQRNILSLQQSIKYLQDQLKQSMTQIANLKGQVARLQYENAEKRSSSEQLQYTIKLKQKQVTFLKDSLEKGSQQNTQLNHQINDLLIKSKKSSQKEQQLQMQIESLISRLSQAHQSLEIAESQHNKYVKQNIYNLTSFLSSFKGGQAIQFCPVHQDQQIKTMMIEFILKTKESKSQNGKQIEQLKEQIHLVEKQLHNAHQRYNLQLDQCLKIQASLKEELQRYQKDKNLLETQITVLKSALQQSTNKLAKLQSQVVKLGQVNSSLGQQISILNASVQSKQAENSKLILRIEQCQQTIKQIEDDYSMYQSRQSNKFEEESTMLKLTISELEEQVRIDAEKYQQLNLQLGEARRQNQQLAKKAGQSIQQLSSKIQELTIEKQKCSLQIVELSGQIQGLDLQIQSLRSQVITLNSTIEALQNEKNNMKQQIVQLTSRIEQQQSNILFQSENEVKLQQMVKEMQRSSKQLKDFSDGLRQKLKKASSKEEQLEKTIYNLKNGQSQLTSKQSDIQKSLKEKTAQLIASCQRIFALEQENARLSKELTFANATIAIKLDIIREHQSKVKQLQQNNEELALSVQRVEQASQDRSAKDGQQIVVLQSRIQQQQRNNQQLTNKIKCCEQQIILLQQQIASVKANNQTLETQVAKNIFIQQKAHAVEEEYLKPIRNNITLLRGHFAEYSRVGDQFEANKNKLLKAMSLKNDLMTEKYTHDRMKDFSFAYNKLKLFILNCQLSQQTKNKAGQQIKKVQIALDRVLRGEK